MKEYQVQYFPNLLCFLINKGIIIDMIPLFAKNIFKKWEMPGTGLTPGDSAAAYFYAVGYSGNVMFSKVL